MRPEILNFLFTPLEKLKGIGEKTLKNYKKLLVKKRKLLSDEHQVNYFDLLYHMPERILQRKIVDNTANIVNGDCIIAKVKVVSHVPAPTPKSPYKILCYLGMNFVYIVYYKVYEKYVNQKFKIGEEVLISGKVDIFDGQVQVVQPDYILPTSGTIPEFENIYPLTYGISNKEIINNINILLRFLPNLPEWLPKNIIDKYHFLSWKDSIIGIHRPKELIDVKNNVYLQRLVFDELLSRQLALCLTKNNNAKNYTKIELTNISRSLKERFIKEKLKFELTNDQKKAIEEIENDTFSNKKMIRLLQGDVGSGKTIVALLTALNYVENKKQVVIMAPTSILAIQHYENISNMCDGMGINIELLIGQTKPKQKKEILQKLADGDIDILIGTHALIQDNVEFKDLGYIVIDEQQRFGVEQRLSLIKKSKEVDILSMTATPIPRTLALTLYSDMDLTIIREKPTNRKPVITTTVNMAKYEDLLNRIEEKFNTDEKVFWICPLVEESEKIDLMNVKLRYEELCKRFGSEKISVIYGQMKEKDDIMEEFATNKEKKILIATTVVEIGIDVKDATIIVIEHP